MKTTITRVNTATTTPVNGLGVAKPQPAIIATPQASNAATATIEPPTTATAPEPQPIEPATAPEAVATLTAPRARLNKALARIAAVQPKRHAKEILQNTRIEANGKLTVVATDMECSAVITLEEVEYSGESTTLVDVHALRKALPKRGAASITIDSAGATCNGATITGANCDEYPQPATAINHYATARVSLTELLPLLKSLLPMTDTESCRYALGGISFELSDDSLNIVGTDGRRLGVATIDSVNSHTDGSEHIDTVAAVVPTDTLKRALKALPASGDVVIEFGRTGVIFRAVDCVFYSRQIEGRFPKWRDVIPSHEKNAHFRAADLLAPMETVKTFSGVDNRGVDLEFHPHVIRYDWNDTESGRTVGGSIEGTSNAGVWSAAALEHLNGCDYDAEQRAFHLQDIGHNAKAYCIQKKIVPAGVVTLDCRFLVDTLKAYGAHAVDVALASEQSVCFTSDALPLTVVIIPLARDRK